MSKIRATGSPTLVSGTPGGAAAPVLDLLHAARGGAVPAAGPAGAHDTVTPGVVIDRFLAETLTYDWLCEIAWSKGMREFVEGFVGRTGRPLRDA